MTDDEVGSVSEEAAKLFSALQDWARGSAQERAGAAGGLAASLRDMGDHVGHGPDCRYCPFCQLLHLVRETSPEVKQHLTVAASSLVQAVQVLLATHAPDGDSAARRGTPVEKIDLDDDSGAGEQA